MLEIVFSGMPFRNLANNSVRSLPKVLEMVLPAIVASRAMPICRLSIENRIKSKTIKSKIIIS